MEIKVPLELSKIDKNLDTNCINLLLKNKKDIDNFINHLNFIEENEVKDLVNTYKKDLTFYNHDVFYNIINFYTIYLLFLILNNDIYEAKSLLNRIPLQNLVYILFGGAVPVTDGADLIKEENEKEKKNNNEKDNDNENGNESKSEILTEFDNSTENENRSLSENLNSDSDLESDLYSTPNLNLNSNSTPNSNPSAGLNSKYNFKLDPDLSENPERFEHFPALFNCVLILKNVENVKNLFNLKLLPNNESFTYLNQIKKDNQIWKTVTEKSLLNAIQREFHIRILFSIAISHNSITSVKLFSYLGLSQDKTKNISTDCINFIISILNKSGYDWTYDPNPIDFVGVSIFKKQFKK